MREARSDVETVSAFPTLLIRGIVVW